jgi:tetratricopeptide (TPR) repeat protein
MSRPLKSLAATVLVIGIAVLGYQAYRHHTHRNQAESQQREPVLLPGIDEPLEMRVPPIPVIIPTDPERMLGEAMKKTENASPDALMPELNRVISKYPDYADAYVMRLASLCKGTDRDAIISNVNQALRYIESSRISKDSTAGLYSVRAKVEHDTGDDTHAMNDIERAIHTNVGEATQLANSGATSPEKTASACTWVEPDTDALVQKFPSDYRAYMFRGLYYSFFETWTPQSVNPAIKAFDKAADLNKQSALPIFFMGQALERAYAFKRISMSEKERNDLNRSIINGMSNAIALDPNLIPALHDRAEAYFELKQFSQAITDYDKIISIDPKDAGAYNDRALAKIQLNDTYGAISDFGKALENKKRELSQSSSYEGRADAYLKTQQWDLAIADLSTAISLQTGGVLVLSNIQQFRALYPEYKTATDEAIAHKLKDTFYPNMDYAGFTKNFLHGGLSKGFFSSTVIPDLYLKRSDAYLKAGKWHSAAVDFRRAENGFPDYVNAIDRWREIGSKGNEHTFIDMRTFDDDHPDSAHVWIKQSQGQAQIDASGTYSVQQYVLNCTSRQIRSVSVANYNPAGDMLGSNEGGKWESVFPDTLGEALFNGACQNK